MTEKIEVLEQQANEYAINLIMNKTLGVGKYHQAFSNKFAELIINESIQVIIENDYHGTWLGEKIKEHFGIPSEPEYSESI
ncbi:hypothetical protein EB001_14790 [bacterium]|nr:hypothetical protein [bacterium]